MGIGDSFCSEFAGAGNSIDNQVFDEGADDALAFFHGAVFEEVAGVAEAFEDGIDEGVRARPLGRDLIELAEAALDLLTFGQEAAEAVLHRFAVLLRRGRRQVDHRVDLRREFLQARLEAASLRGRVGPGRGELPLDERPQRVPPPRA
ncbi:hypothetical protein KJ682_01990 [bacterium]|nr:hypothetical protein [bacterium]